MISHNYNDKPEEACNKIFLQVSKVGMVYLFLWFYPMHGNCMGIYMIPETEDQKMILWLCYTQI